MALICLKPPVDEPVTLQEVKNYLKVDHDVDDGLIKGLIKAARQTIEAYTARSLLRQEWRLTVNAGFAVALSESGHLSMERFSREKGIELPRSPFMALLGDPKILNGYGVKPIKNYRLDQTGSIARIHFMSDVAVNFHGQGTVEIDFAAGFGDSPQDVPAAIPQAMMLLVAQLYENRGGANDNTGFGMLMNNTIVSLVKPYQQPRLF